MADFVFNAAKGRFVGWADGAGTANIEVLAVLIKTGQESDGAMIDRGTLAEVLANSTEADFTNYVRKVIAVSVVVDDVANQAEVAASPITWVSAGGAVNNALSKLVMVYDPDTATSTDADRIPISAHDLAGSTDGADFEVVPSDTGGVVARAT